MGISLEDLDSPVVKQLIFSPPTTAPDNLHGTPSTLCMLLNLAGHSALMIERLTQTADAHNIVVICRARISEREIGTRIATCGRDDASAAAAPVHIYLPLYRALSPHPDAAHAYSDRLLMLSSTLGAHTEAR